MSEIKALEELRELCDSVKSSDFASVGCDAVLEIADEIEAEIAERFMELPVDADGVPIRPDDLMACTAFDTNDFDGKEHVMAVSNGFWVDKDGCTHIPSETRHVNPRTLEDVLREFTDEVIEWSGYSGPVSGDRTWSGMAAKYADEIREIMGGEE